MSGRTLIWKNIISGFDWKKYILIGRGNTLIDQFGIVRRAHNGHFHLILSYGFFAYLDFLYLFFRKPKRSSWKKYILVVPLLLLFSVNTLVIDYRASLALAVIAAVYQTEVERKEHV